MVSGTWHFPDRSMCADTHTQLEVSGKLLAIQLLSVGPKTNILGLHRAYCTLKNLLYNVGMAGPEFPGSTEL